MNEDRPNNMNDRKDANCPRQFELVQAISGVAQPGKTEAILRHIDSCPRCDGIIKLLRKSQHEFMSQHPANIVSTQLIARARKHERSRRIAFWLAPAGAAILAVLLVILLIESPRPDSGIRTKGDISLKFYIQQGDQAIPGQSGGVYHENDRIQFVYSSGANRYLFLVSVDDQGLISNFNHEGKIDSVLIVSGIDRVLEGSIILDDSTGLERIFAVFSKQPLHFDQIKQAAQAAYRDLCSQGKSVRDLQRLPLEFPQASVLIHKH